jgi:hypothetical protein
MTEAGALTFQFKADTSEFTNGLKQAINGLNSLADEAKSSAQQISGHLSKITSSAGEVSNPLKKASTELKAVAVEAKSNGDALKERMKEIAESSKSVGEGIASSYAKAAMVIAGLTAAYALAAPAARLLYDEASKTLTLYQKLAEQSRDTGQSTTTIRAFQNYGAGFGVKAEDSLSSLQKVRDLFTQMQKGETVLEDAFAKGDEALKKQFNSAKNVEDAFRRIIDVIGNGKYQTAVAVGGAIGIDEKTVARMRESNIYTGKAKLDVDEMTQRAKELGLVINSGMTQSAAVFAKETQNANDKLSQTWDLAANRLRDAFGGLAPLVQTLNMAWLTVQQTIADVAAGVALIVKTVADLTAGAIAAAKAIASMQIASVRVDNQPAGDSRTNTDSRGRYGAPYQIDGEVRRGLAFQRGRLLEPPKFDPPYQDREAQRGAALGGLSYTSPREPPPPGKGGGGRAEARDAVENYVASLERSKAVLQQEIDLWGKTRTEVEAAKALEMARAAAKKEGRDLTEAEVQKVRQLGTAYGALKDKLEELRDRQQSMLQVAQTFASAIADWAINGTKAKDVFASLAKSIANMALQATLMGQGPLAGLFGTKSADGGNSLGGLFGAFTKGIGGGGGFGDFIGPRLPGFAAGGTVPSNQWAIVGEKGPELIRSGSGGASVIPNNVMAAQGGRQASVFHIDARGAQVGVAEQITSALKAYDAQLSRSLASRVNESGYRYA